MTSNVNAADAGGGGDTITITLSGGRSMEMSESFARRLDSKMDDVSEGVDSTNRYSQDDALYGDVGHVIELLDRAGIEKHKGNRERLDSSAEDYIVALSGKLSSQQRNALTPGETEVGDAANVKGYVDDFRSSFDAEMAKKYPVQTASAPSSGSSGSSNGAGGDMDMSGVKALLGDVKASDNSSEKASFLSKAIKALIAQIKGGGSAAGGASAGGPSSEAGKDLKSDIDALRDAVGGMAPSGRPRGGDAAAGRGEGTPPPAQRASAGTDVKTGDAGGEDGGRGGGGGERRSSAPRTQTLSGDDLMGRLDGGGRKLTFDPSDLGIGIGNDEIGRGETMTFRPDGAATGGSVDLVDLFGPGGGGQETATIKVMKDGKQVDAITVRGDMDGNQTVKIGRAFDELVFEAGEGRGTDFAIKSITTETAGADVPDTPDTPGAPGAPSTGGPETPAVTPAETPAKPSGSTWSPSVKYNANDSLTVEMKDASGKWVGIDTKAKGGSQQGQGNLADFEAGATPEVRLRDNQTGQIIGMDSPQARITKQADGSIVVSFEDRAKGDNDFDDAVVTLKPGKPGKPAAGGAEKPGGADGPAEAARAEFDVTQLLELLQALSDSVSLIDGAKGLTEGQQNELFDKIADVIAPIATALDAKGEGGSDVTPDEVVGIMEAVMGLTGSIEARVDDSTDKNEALDSLAMGVGKVADEMAA